ncbi:MAG: peptidylprolyl isomerase [Burkholderiales bacterium]|nr:peptidylprolyl isomerase [Burkholderiales bacterium]
MLRIPLFPGSSGGARASLVLLLACVLGAPGAWAQELVDRVVAVVNSDVVTKLDLEREVQIAMQTLRRQGTQAPAREILEKQMLERLVTRSVLTQQARQSGLRVSEADIDSAIERIAAENKIGVPALRTAVEKDGIAFDRFREDLRGEILLARLRDREVDSRVTVTDGEIQSFVRAQEAQPEKVDEFNLAHIVIQLPERASPEELKLRRGRAEEALRQIRAGTDFRQVAASFSDAPDALQGGEMGWRTPGRLPTLFVEALGKLKVGEVSDIIRSPAGLHILKLNDKRGNNTPVVVEQTRARHVLIRLNEVVSETDALNRLRDLKDRIEHGADFTELARLHSDDTSAARGGDLGWISPGDTVPEFEQAMHGLRSGQVSGPFKTAFGWHIVQVLERREQDMSKDRQRLTARQAIRARKADEQWGEWVRQQRDKAYVELRLEEQ